MCVHLSYGYLCTQTVTCHCNDHVDTAHRTEIGIGRVHAVRYRRHATERGRARREVRRFRLGQRLAETVEIALSGQRRRSFCDAAHAEIVRRDYAYGRGVSRGNAEHGLARTVSRPRPGRRVLAPADRRRVAKRRGVAGHERRRTENALPDQIRGGDC